MDRKAVDELQVDAVKPEAVVTSDAAVIHGPANTSRGTSPQVSGAAPPVTTPPAATAPHVAMTPDNVTKPETPTMSTSTAATVAVVATPATTTSAQHLIPRPAGQHLPVAQQQGKPQPFVRQNTVGSVMLHGVNIVSLVIDGKERLCLAQISNTLLKDYSYNEIHNRRVALGITCVQCTPVQLEILRRAGAMPVSSRRCGMITKREAERLVKSFLEDARPPRLPDNFSFDVRHDCGWGSRGNFIPSRYNSSRAKCIKCSFCNMFFSPNKFIFHFHRTPDSKYNHPDAANFNSWRRHLKLTDANASEELCYAWEDVKAMFNGGTRKRMLGTHSSGGSSSSSSSSSSSTSSSSVSHSRSTHVHTGSSHPHTPSPSPLPPQEYAKRPKMEAPSLPSPGAHGHSLPLGTAPGQPQHYQYPVFPVPNKVVPMKSVPAHPAFSMPFNYDKPMVTAPDTTKPSVNGGWPTTLPETFYPPYEMIWAKHLGLTAPESSFAHGNMPMNSHCDVTMSTSPRGPQLLSPSSTGSRDDRQCMDTASEFSDRSSMRSNASAMSDRLEPVRPEMNTHMSAFRPVLQRDALPEPELELASPGRSIEPEVAHEDAMEDRKLAGDVMSDNEDVDVDTIDDSVDFKTRMCKYDLPEENNNDPSRPLSKDRMLPAPITASDCVDLSVAGGERQEEIGRRPRSAGSVDVHDQPAHIVDTPRRPSSVGDTMTGSLDLPPTVSEPVAPLVAAQFSSPRQDVDDTPPRHPTPPAHTNRSNHSSSPPDQGRCHQETDGGWKDLSVLSRDDLREELRQEIRTRRKLEEDCRVIKETFQEQVQREVAYREEMAKQLQVVRETLCHELDQERKVRFSLQQKLKEAHDALHNFSCKMLASRQCSECSFKEPVMPR